MQLLQLLGCLQSICVKNKFEDSPAIDVNIETTRNPSAPLSESEIQSRIECPSTPEVIKFSYFSAQYAWVSQRGYYPDAPNKENQDSYIILPKFGTSPDQAFFGVFDGHGKDGHLCARFVMDNLPRILKDVLVKAETSTAVKESLTMAHTLTNDMLHNNHRIDDSLSGTTAISVLFRGNTIYVSNVGDSRAILISTTTDGRITSKTLSSDQTPYRKDERDRVKRSGARVLSMDQIEGLDTIHENWGSLKVGDEIDEGGDPPRVWSPLGDYPGTAFTRSLGDLYAEELGVFAEPEILERVLGPEDLYVVIASDGVFEFLTNQMVAEIIVGNDNPLDSCKAVVAQSYNLWLQYEIRTDDITIIVLKLDGLLRQENKRTVTITADTLKLETSKPVRRVLSKEKKKIVIQDIDHQRSISNVDFSLDLEQESFETVIIPKTDEEKELILSAIKNSFIFQHLNPAQRDGVIGAMQRRVVTAGEWVITQGDHGDRLYIIDNGKFEVRVRGGGEDDATTGGNVVHVYESSPTFHPSFGELSLMYGKPRAASVIAVTDGVLWSLDRRVFRNEVLRTVDMRRDILHTLRRVEMLKSLTLQQLQRLADLLSEEVHRKGTYIIRQGEIGETFYVIMRGRCDCTINGVDGAPERVVLKLKDSDYFGERALLTSGPRAANVIAVTDVKLLYIGKKAFEEVLGPLSDIIDEDRRRREAAALESLKPPASFSDISFVGVVASDQLGPLLLGTVNASVSNISVRSFVLSEVNSANQSRQVLNILVAHRAISRIAETNVVLPRILERYLETNALHLLFNSPIVADLSTIARANIIILPDAAIVYVAACIICALEILHKTGIIYRAVQPETVHVDSLGRIVLMDYRISKVSVPKGRTFTICGAADYLAPEQISQQGHDFSADFWALGVLISELATGEHPFSNSSEVAVFSKITSLGSTESFQSLPIPSTVSTPIKDLIHQLVVPRPSERLGAREGGIDELKRHPAFQDIDWATFLSRPSPLLSLATSAAEEVATTGFPSEMREIWSTPNKNTDWLVGLKSDF